MPVPSAAVPSAAWGDPQLLTALAYRAGDATVIALSGSLDGGGTAALDESVTEALGKGRPRLVLDRHQLRALDTDALEATRRDAERRGASLAAAGASRSLGPSLEPLVAQGLRLHSNVRSAVGDSDYRGADS